MRCALHVGQEMRPIDGVLGRLHCPVMGCVRVSADYDALARNIQFCTTCGVEFSIPDGISLSYSKCKKCRGKATASR